MRQKVTVATALVRARALLRFSSNTSTTSSINIFALTTTMGWFWGSSSSGDGNKSQDPLRGLDPSLRDFLAKESPVKYSSSDPPPPPAPKPIPTPTSSSSRNPAAPEESSGKGTNHKRKSRQLGNPIKRRSTMSWRVISTGRPRLAELHWRTVP